MKFFDPVYHFFAKMSSVEFRLYGLIAGAVVIVAVIGLDVQLYRKSRVLLKKIKRLNDEREERVKTVLAQGSVIKKQKEEMHRVLSEDVDFKIAGYSNTVLEKLGLSKNKMTETATQSDVDATYRESTLQIRLEDMNMRDLVELLQVFEDNKRISVKQLEIVKSLKKLNTIEVVITITTMLLKTFSES